MRLLLFSWLMCMLSVGAMAQQQGKVEVSKDPLIGLLQKRRVALQDVEAETPQVSEKKGIKTTAPGYRVQIYSGSDRSKAYAEQGKFKRMFADLDTYISYDEPNFRVKVGDFTNRREAQELMNALKKNFSSVFLFPETVNVEY